MNSKAVEFTKKEIIAGLFVLISIIILIAFILTVRGYRPYAGTKIYYTKFKNTLGLDRGADVRYGGLKIGKVIDIFTDPEDITQVCVKIAVAPNIILNQKCVATVEQVSLTSARHLEISTGDAQAPVLEEGGLIASVNKSGGIVELPDFSSTIAKVEQLLDDLTDFLGMERTRTAEASGENRPRVSDLTKQINDTLSEGKDFITELKNLMGEQKPHITEIVKNVTDIEKDVKKLLEQVNAVIAENRGPIRDSMNSIKEVLTRVQTLSEKTADDLETILANVEEITSNVDTLSSEARNWIGKNRRNLDEVMLDLKETIRNLRILSQTLAEQPQSLITGKIPGGKK
ncbi:MAG TPA: MlaD family protein [Candidatus Hydrogenedens sp.]|nr:MlaD family protein [Candidatus Hydrogenedens sp.]HOK09526.1 MlaD family protein [Candidatus Hydrogenedens sp.]HPP58389.1 MlaD family protein [Candidatus Hydrogenedens sp.]